MYREEYPRPNFIRPDWQSLNGLWDFEIADGTSRQFASYFDGSPYASVIEVPFAPQSPLSGIGRDENLRSVWYRRRFEVEEGKLGGTVLLNFGAVDYRADVYVNGRPAGAHRGGYTPFTLEIGELLRVGVNEIVLNALDDDQDPFTPSGMQGKNGMPHCTGIWQSVWLEFASRTYLSAYRATPNLTQKAVIAQGRVDRACKGKIEAEVFLDGKSLAKYKYELKPQFLIRIPVGDTLSLWEPGNGKFYDIVLALSDENGERLDTVLTYSAFRQIEVKGQTIAVNGKPVTLKQAADTRYYPKGHYTAPSEEAIKQDLLCALSLGMNGVRIPGVLAEPLYLYYADKLGLLVTEEYPSPQTELNDLTRAVWAGEWSEILERDFGHPSIIFWKPVGGYNGADSGFVNYLIALTVLTDPSRPAIDGDLHYKTPVFEKRIDAKDSESFLDEVYHPKNGETPAAKEKRKLQQTGAMSEEALAKLPLLFHSVLLPQAAYAETRVFKQYLAAYINAMMAAKAAGFGFISLYDTPACRYGFYSSDRDFKFDRAAEASIRKFLNQIK